MKGMSAQVTTETELGTLREISRRVGGLVEDYAHYARGEAAAVDPAVPELTGHPARDLVGFARDHAGSFAAPSPSQA